MGKKAQVKQQKSKESEMNKGKEANLDLSKQKRNELNRLIDKLLKVSSIIVGTGKIRDSHVEMEKLLEKIVEIENEVNVGFPSRNRATMKSLTDWMLENGSKIDGVEICEFEGYDYGLRSLKDINQNDLMISVPRKLMMTTEFARKSELEYLMQNDALLAHMPSMSLALFLLLEKFRGNSFWEPYLNSLPSSYNTVMYFTLDELDALKGSPTYEPALKQCQNIARQYGYLYSLFYNSNDAASAILRKVFTYEQYRWAVSTVMTRQNFIPANSPHYPMVLALIPYWDMGNHDNAELTTDYNIDCDQSEYYSCRDYKKGEQVCMSYGRRPNSELFLHNGFVHVNNIADGTKLRLGVSKSDPLVSQKKELLNKLSIPSSAEFLLPANPRPFAPHDKFIAFLRIFNMEQETIEKYLNGESTDDLLCPNIPHPVDSKVWQFLTTRINLLLSTYPTTLEEDEKLLEENKSLSSCMRLTVLMRLTEKRILHNTLEDLKKAQESYQSTENKTSQEETKSKGK